MASRQLVTNVLWLVIVGCPADLEVAAARGQPCDVDTDCDRPETPCGEVLACLAGRCQVSGDEPAIIDICTDAASILIDGGASTPQTPVDAGAFTTLDASVDGGAFTLDSSLADAGE